MGFGIDVPTVATAGQVSGDTHGNTIVTLPQVAAQAGYAVQAGEAGAAADPGGVLHRAIYGSEFKRGRAGIDQLLFYEYFSGATTLTNALNQNTLKQINSGSTLGVDSSGFLFFNSASATNASQGNLVQSYRCFSALPHAPLHFGCSLKTGTGTAALATKILEIGLFQCTSAVGAILDGVAFRYTSTGTLVGVLSINGTETVTSNFTLPSDNVLHVFEIVLSTTLIEFYIDGALQGTITVPSGSAAATGLQFQQPISMHLYNTSAVGAADTMKVSDCWVYQDDEASNRPVAARCAGMGGHASFVQTGQAIGMTPNIANSANPTAGNGSNSSGNISGLGGDFAINAPASAATDYIVSDYAVPAIGAQAGVKTLFVTGIHISCTNIGAVVATTPTQIFFGAAWGQTAANLATADGIAAHAPRRMLLGGMTIAVGAAIGAMYDRDIHITLATPMAVNPGEHFAIYMKVVTGTATASQVIRGIVGIDGYWE